MERNYQNFYYGHDYSHLPHVPSSYKPQKCSHAKYSRSGLKNSKDNDESIKALAGPSGGKQSMLSLAELLVSFSPYNNEDGSRNERWKPMTLAQQHAKDNLDLKRSKYKLGKESRYTDHERLRAWEQVLDKFVFFGTVGPHIKDKNYLVGYDPNENPYAGYAQAKYRKKEYDENSIWSWKFEVAIKEIPPDEMYMNQSDENFRMTRLITYLCHEMLHVWIAAYGCNSCSGHDDNIGPYHHGYAWQLAAHAVEYLLGDLLNLTEPDIFGASSLAMEVVHQRKEMPSSETLQIYGIDPAYFNSQINFIQWKLQGDNQPNQYSNTEEATDDYLDSFDGDDYTDSVPGYIYPNSQSASESITITPGLRNLSLNADNRSYHEKKSHRDQGHSSREHKNKEHSDSRHKDKQHRHEEPKDREHKHKSREHGEHHKHSTSRDDKPHRSSTSRDHPTSSKKEKSHKDSASTEKDRHRSEHHSSRTKDTKLEQPKDRHSKSGKR